MTDLTSFLTALYGSVTDAEVASRRHGRERLLELLEAGEFTAADALPVYHATDVDVTLDVCLRTEPTETGHTVVVDDCPPEDGTSLSFTIELLDVVEARDAVPDETDPDEDEGEESPPDEGNGGRIDVERVPGIDEKRAHRLREAGIEWVDELVQRSPEEVAHVVRTDGDRVSVEETSQWIVRGANLLAAGAAAASPNGDADTTERRDEDSSTDAPEKWADLDDVPVESVDGIGEVRGERLRAAGIESVPDLVRAGPKRVSKAASDGDTSVSPGTAKRWIARGEARLRDERSER